MDKIYLLLRNNQQTGPYTKDEILQMGLKPYDLIWVEGRSTGWKSPEEISAFKFNVQGAPQTSQIIPIDDKRETKNSLPAFEEIKDVKKPSEKGVYISLPRNKNVEDPATAQQESFNERVAKMQQRFAAQTIEQPGDADTKYSRSLEEIKQEYSTWLHSKKVKGKRVSNEQLFLSAIGIVVLAALGYFAISSNNDDFKSLNFNLATTTSETTANDQIASDDQSPIFEPSEPETIEPQNATPVNQEEVLINPQDGTKNISVANNDDSYLKRKTPQQLTKNIFVTPTKSVVTSASNKPVTQATVKPEETQKEVHVTSTTSPIINNKIEKNSSVQTSQPGNKISASSTDKKVPLTVHVSLKGKVLTGAKKDGVKGYEVQLQNTSDHVLRVVAVDLYYSSKGKVIKKETVYFSNVQPHSTNTILAPANKNASQVRHQLGLISSEQGLYYVKQ